MDSGRISGKIYFWGKLKVKENSFLSINSGLSDERTDSTIYMDADGIAIIPATSFAGALRHHFEKLSGEENTNELFGNSDKSSTIVFFDLYTAGNNRTYIQHRIGIDRKKLSTRKGAKFDKEILLNNEFEVFFYIEKVHNIDDSIYKQYMDNIQYILNNETIFFLGGDNSIGNGWMRFENIKCVDYSFKEPEKLKAFLLREGDEINFIKYLKNIDKKSEKMGSNLPTMSEHIIIKYTLDFNDFILTNDAEADTDEGDFNFLKIDKKFLIQGSSIKGVIRSRAEMIANTVGIDKELIKNIFGSEKNKSNIFFSNAILEGKEEIKKIDSLSIDRFTGGAVEKAKFDFNVLITSEFKGEIILYLSDPEIYALGLLYLIFRDIKNQDLSFGYGRTKGWGILKEFNYSIIEQKISEKFEKYFSEDMFNIDQIEPKYREKLGEKK